MSVFGRQATNSLWMTGAGISQRDMEIQKAINYMEATMADQEQAVPAPTIVTNHQSSSGAILPGVLKNFFTYHSPVGDQPARYVALRDKALELAVMITRYCPPSADTTAAIRLLREAVMTANASIACGE